MDLSLDISEIEYALIACSMLMSGIFLSLMWMRNKAVKRCTDGDDAVTITDREALPEVSVIVYAHSDAEYLRHNLPYLLNQDYPTFEVIVVNDGLSIDDSNIVTEFAQQYSNIYQTFVPQDTRNVSRKKLAIMVGIKAAKYDIIVTTNANCCPKSPNWLEMMARNFVPGVDVVVGDAAYNYKTDRDSGRRYRLFDTVNTRLQFLWYAISGHPYRGTSSNLAYRKSTFFENKGFSRSMNLHHGDDDIFVNEIAFADNTRVELSPESRITTEMWNVAKMHQEDKFHHDFTSKYIKTSAFAVQGFMSTIYYLNLATISALVALNYTHIIVLGIALALLLLLTLSHIFIFRKGMRLLHEPRLFFSIPLFTLLRPIVNWRYRLRGHQFRTQNFTWQRLK